MTAEPKTKNREPAPFKRLGKASVEASLSAAFSIHFGFNFKFSNSANRVRTSASLMFLEAATANR